MTPLKILTYNILNGGEERLDAITAVIRSHQPDAVALLEANSLENARRLALDLAMDLYYGEANNAFSVAWLSRQPVQTWQNHRHEVFAKTLLEIDLAWEGGLLPLFATHLDPGLNEQAEQHRLEEVKTIMQIMDRYQGQPHLLAGDFNAIHPHDLVGDPPADMPAEHQSWPPVAALLEAGYVDCYRSMRPQEPGYTFPAHAPWLRIDFLLASPSLAARLAACEFDSGETAQRASDHLPVWAEFK